MTSEAGTMVERIAAPRPLQWDRKLPLLDRLRANWVTIIHHEQTVGFMGREESTEHREVSANPDGAEAALLIERLMGYVAHDTGCSANELDPLDDTPCTCGLRPLLGIKKDRRILSETPHAE